MTNKQKFIVFFIVYLFAGGMMSAEDIEDVRVTPFLPYLKSKYLGKQTKFLGVQRQSEHYYSKIKNIIAIEEDFYAVLDSKKKVKFSFITTLFRRRQDQSRVIQEKQLKLQTLQTQEAINLGIKNTLSEAVSNSSSSSSLRNLETNINRYYSRNDFTTENKITYTNSISKKESSDFFIVSTDGLFLKNGTLINVILEPMNE